MGIFIYYTVVICFLYFELVSSRAIPRSTEDNAPFTVIKTNENAVVKYGQVVEMQCMFDELVYCGWQRKGVLVNIDHRYAYKTGDGKETKDCSMQITSVQEIDIGDWICESLGTSETKSKTGFTATLTRKNHSDNTTKTTLKIRELTTKSTTLEESKKTESTAIDDIRPTNPEDKSNNEFGVESIATIGVLSFIILLLLSALSYLIYKHRNANQDQVERPTETASTAELAKLNEHQGTK